MILDARIDPLVGHLRTIDTFFVRYTTNLSWLSVLLIIRELWKKIIFYFISCKFLCINLRVFFATISESRHRYMTINFYDFLIRY